MSLKQDPFFVKNGSAMSNERRKQGFSKNKSDKKSSFKKHWQSKNKNTEELRGSEDNNSKKGFIKSKFGGHNVDKKLHRVQEGRIDKENSDKSGKPFDKKTYRLKKYSNKYKLEKWENQRRKDVLKKYYKEVKKDPMAGKYKPFNFDEMPNIDDDSDDEGDESDKDAIKSADEVDRVHYVLHPDRLEKVKQKINSKKHHVQEDRLDKKGKIQPFLMVKQKMQKLKEEKIAKKEATQKAAKEREEALAKYKTKKAEKFKKLSRKTKTGQPFMKDRMQMLLDTIQKTI